MEQEQTTPNWIVTPYAGLQVNSTAISDDGAHLITGTSAEYDSSDNFAVYYYTTDGTTATEVWHDPLGDNIQQGVFWVAISGDGNYGAAGGQYGSGKGFLRTYHMPDGVNSKQEFSYTSRINEVEIAADGSAMVAVESANIQFFTLGSSGYSQAETKEISGAYMRSCGITPNGQYLVAGGEVYSDDSEPVEAKRHRESASSSTGVLYLYENQNGSLNYLGHYEADSGILRVVISRDGNYFAASTKTGQVMLFANPITLQDKLFPLWIYTNTDYQLGLSYALAICNTPEGNLYVASGGNFVGGSDSANDSDNDYGYAYMLQNTIDSYNNNVPKRLWIYQLQYCPNPGMNMDAYGKFVTSADGQPIFNDSESDAPPAETPGNFYLFNAQTGYLYWKYGTSLMNWPMVINTGGYAVFAGSDNGSVYYWSPLNLLEESED